MTTNSNSGVSIVIPAFNRERYVAKTIESALKQSVAPIEVVLVDDGSTDATAQISQSFAAPVKVIRIVNNGSGPSRPRNVGIASAKGPFITLIDSDDVLHPDTLLRHRQLLERRDDLGLVTNNYVSEFQRNGNVERRVLNQAVMAREYAEREFDSDTYWFSSEIAFLALCHGNFLRSCTGVTFPKSVWKDVGGFDESFRTSNDYEFFMRVMRKYSLAYINRPLRTLVHHDANISAANIQQTLRPELLLNHLRVLERALKYSNGEKVRQALRGSIREWRSDLAYVYRENGQYGNSLSELFRCAMWNVNLFDVALAMSKVVMLWACSGVRVSCSSKVEKVGEGDA